MYNEKCLKGCFLQHCHKRFMKTFSHPSPNHLANVDINKIFLCLLGYTYHLEQARCMNQGMKQYPMVTNLHSMSKPFDRLLAGE